MYGGSGVTPTRSAHSRTGAAPPNRTVRSPASSSDPASSSAPAWSSDPASSYDEEPRRVTRLDRALGDRAGGKDVVELGRSHGPGTLPDGDVPDASTDGGEKMT